MPLDPDLHHRFAYHSPPDDETAQRHENVRAILENTAQQISMFLPDGREKALFVTKLEEAMFWANAAIARSNAIGDE